MYGKVGLSDEVSPWLQGLVVVVEYGSWNVFVPVYTIHVCIKSSSIVIS